MFKNCVIYLLILSRTFAQLVDRNKDNKGTTPDIQQEVQKEIAPVLKKFEDYLDTVDNKDARLLRKGEFLGELMSLGRKAIKAYVKADVLLKEQGALQNQKNHMQDKALKLFVIPYFCQKFELYGEHWDPKVVKINNFDPDDLTGTSFIKRDLDEQTRASYRAQAKKWNRILCNSTHRLAIQFKTSLGEKYPGVPLSTLAKDLGLAIALLNNAKHGVIANDPDLQELLQIDSAIAALSKWASLSDPVMLNVIYEFEKVTTNREWKPK